MAAKQHECSAEMRGDASRVLDALVTALAASGFRVERRTANEVELAGPAPFSSHHSPMVGASRVVARASGRRLAVTTELGGVERIKRYMLLLPLLICGGFALVLGVVFLAVSRGDPETSRWHFLAPAIPLVVILLIVTLVVRPLAARRLEQRTTAALDGLVTSIASIGG